MKQYEYMTLNYRHDALTGEFVIVGVALLCGNEFLGGKFRKQSKRAQDFFGEISVNSYKSMIGHLESEFHNASEVLDSYSGRSLSEIAHGILPVGDGAYQWSSMKRGYCEEPQSELSRLFDRLVTRYESDSVQTEEECLIDKEKIIQISEALSGAPSREALSGAPSQLELNSFHLGGKVADKDHAEAS